MQHKGRPATSQRSPKRSTRSGLLDANHFRVAQIMSQPAICCRPEMSVEAVAELLMRNGLSRLPVIDETHRLVGMISKTDLIEEYYERGDTAEVEADTRWREGVPLAEQGFHLHQPGATVAEVVG